MKFLKNIFRFVFFAFIIAMSFHGASNILWKAGVYAEGFQSAHFNYETVRTKSSMKGALVGIEAKSILPDDAVVKIITQKLNLTQVALRYHLFPIKTGDGETHIIDVNRTMVPLEGEKRELHNESVVYAKPPHNFVEKSENFIRPSFFTVVLFVFFYTTWLVSVGALVLCLMKINIVNTGKSWFVSTSYLLGYGIFTCLVWVYLIGGGNLDRINILLLGVLLTAILSILYRAMDRKGIQNIFSINKDSFSYLKEKQAFLSGMCLIVLLISVFIITITTPVRDWDGMSHWILKAKAIFHAKQLVFDYTHLNYYPLLWPLNISIQFELLGGMFDEVAQWTSALFFLVFIMQLIKALAVIGVGHSIRYLMVIVFIINAFQNPFREYITANFVIANAENIFLAYLSAAISTILVWLRYRRRSEYMMLGVLMMCGLNLSKLEGGVASIFLIVSLSLLLFNIKIKAREKIWLGLSLLTVFLPLGWVHWINIHDYGSRLSHLRTSLSIEKLCILMKMSSQYFFINNLALLFILGVLYLSVYPNKKNWNGMEKFLFLASVLFLLFACFAIVGWPADRIATLFPVVFSRLFLHAAPIFLLLLGSKLFSKL